MNRLLQLKILKKTPLQPYLIGPINFYCNFTLQSETKQPFKQKKFPVAVLECVSALQKSQAVFEPMVWTAFFGTVSGLECPAIRICCSD